MKRLRHQDVKKYPKRVYLACQRQRGVCAICHEELEYDLMFFLKDYDVLICHRRHIRSL